MEKSFCLSLFLAVISIGPVASQAQNINYGPEYYLVHQIWGSFGTYADAEQKRQTIALGRAYMVQQAIEHDTQKLAALQLALSGSPRSTDVDAKIDELVQVSHRRAEFIANLIAGQKKRVDLVNSIYSRQDISISPKDTAEAGVLLRLQEIGDTVLQADEDTIEGTSLEFQPTREIYVLIGKVFPKAKGIHAIADDQGLIESLDLAMLLGRNSPCSSEQYQFSFSDVNKVAKAILAAQVQPLTATCGKADKPSVSAKAHQIDVHYSNEFCLIGEHLCYDTAVRYDPPPEETLRAVLTALQI
jgi:hypothetical protein